MPHSLREILASADAMAESIENDPPAMNTDERTGPALAALHRARVARVTSESDALAAVIQARAAGLPWRKIAERLGTTPQSAIERYGDLVREARHASTP